MLRAVGGLVPYDGTITLFGQEVKSMPSRQRALRLAFVRQSLSLVFDLTLTQYVLLGRAPHKGWLAPYSREDYRLVDEALRTVEMTDFADRSMLNLSGGEQQRVVLAQALVQQTDILLLDEPTSHLDVHHQFEFLEHVRRLTAAGRTVLSVFHDLEMAARYCAHLFVMDGGRIVAEGAPAEVLTETLLEEVFRMTTRVHPQPDGSVRIQYLNKISQPREHA